MELLAVLAILALVSTISGIAWLAARGRVETASAARVAEMAIVQARMTSIYRGVNHFVVLDPVGRSVEIYADTGSTPGSFDDDDPRVSASQLSENVRLTLPAAPTPLSSPLDSSAVSAAWSLPDPDASARWGTTLKGVMATPTGLLQSAEATPQTIGAGVIVFSDGVDDTAAVGIRGRAGSARAFRLQSGSWKEL